MTSLREIRQIERQAFERRCIRNDKVDALLKQLLTEGDVVSLFDGTQAIVLATCGGGVDHGPYVQIKYKGHMGEYKLDWLKSKAEIDLITNGKYSQELERL